MVITKELSYWLFHSVSAEIMLKYTTLFEKFYILLKVRKYHHGNKDLWFPIEKTSIARLIF